MIGATTTNDNDLIDGHAERDAYVGEKNAHTVVAYAEKTRELQRETEAKVQHLENTVLTLQQQVTALQQTVAVMRAATLGGGATSA